MASAMMDLNLQSMAPLDEREKLVSIEDLISILRSCEQKKSLAYAKYIHVYVSSHGLDRELADHLVPVLTECGGLDNSHQVLRKSSHQATQSWTTLIQAYSKVGDPLAALNLFQEMAEHLIEPSRHTFIATLKACAKLRSVENGRQIHHEITKRGLEKVVYIGNSLVDMYAKCGSVGEAHEVLVELPVRDVVTWTALATGYAEQQNGEEVLNCLEKMQLDCISPNYVTFICSLKACGSIRAINRGQEIHADIVKQGLEGQLFVCSAIVDMYAKCGLLAEARHVFDKLPVRDTVLWNVLIAGYAEHGLSKETLACVKEMQQDGVPFDDVTFLSSLKACCTANAVDWGEWLYTEIAKEGYEVDPLIGTSLLCMYAECGLLAEAQEAFEGLQVKDVVSWTALISGYAEHGYAEEALNCLIQMPLEGFSPDAVTLLCSLKACGILGSIDRARELHAEIAYHGFEREIDCSILADVFIDYGTHIFDQISPGEASELVFATALIDMYGKCGSMLDAHWVFDSSSSKFSETWTALLTGYARHGQTANVFCLLERMREEGIHPRGVTFLSVLSACSHAGLVNDGQRYFEAMSKEYGVSPSIKHQNCMVDLLARAGQLDGVMALLEKLPLEPDLITWSAVLGACSKWDDVKFGRQAFNNVKLFDEKHAALNTLMGNIYASARVRDNAC